MLRHRSEIPYAFALAVYAIMHNKATIEHWDELDKVTQAVALKWIESILIDNEQTDRLDDQLAWFKRELGSLN